MSAYAKSIKHATSHAEGCLLVVFFPSRDIRLAHYCSLDRPKCAPRYELGAQKRQSNCGRHGIGRVCRSEVLAFQDRINDRKLQVSRSAHCRTTLASAPGRLFESVAFAMRGPSITFLAQLSSLIWATWAVSIPPIVELTYENTAHWDLSDPHDALVARQTQDPACKNGPLTRACWQNGFSIATDFDNKLPPAGRTVMYDLEITNTTHLAPDGFQRFVMAVNGQYRELCQHQCSRLMLTSSSRTNYLC